MTYDGRCQHGVYTHPLPPWERCDVCRAEHQAKVDERKEQVLRSFKNYIETGSWHDLDTSVGSIYYAAYQQGTVAQRQRQQT
jgi:hypothetical protein